MYELEILEQRITHTEDEISDLDKEIAKEKAALEKQKEKTLEAKMHRIAMEEICNCTKESLFRRMGYVESFHGYPDMAKKCPNCKEVVNEK